LEKSLFKKDSTIEELKTSVKGLSERVSELEAYVDELERQLRELRDYALELEKDLAKRYANLTIVLCMTSKHELTIENFTLIVTIGGRKRNISALSILVSNNEEQYFTPQTYRHTYIC
jgi:flagellar biosynthesis chaperone FliJ